VPRQATFARRGAASGACSRRAGRKSSYWTYSGFRPVRREGVPGDARREARNEGVEEARGKWLVV